jgi:hypothetical protein
MSAVAENNFVEDMGVEGRCFMRSSSNGVIHGSPHVLYVAVCIGYRIGDVPASTEIHGITIVGREPLLCRDNGVQRQYAPFANGGRDTGRDKTLTCTKTYISKFGLRTFTFHSVPFCPMLESRRTR